MAKTLPNEIHMNLKDQLESQRIESESSRNQTQVDTMKNASKQLVASGIEKNALGVGDKIPLFSLPNAHGKTVEIKALLQNGPIVLTFYRGSWCPYCNLELRAYQSHLAKIKSHGAQIVAISPELPDRSLSNTEKFSLEFEVLSDVGNVIAREFGLVFKMSDDLAEVYKQLNSDITKYNGDNRWELPIPATYVVGSDGKITYSYVNADYLERADPQQVIAALAEFSAK